MKPRADRPRSKGYWDARTKPGLAWSWAETRLRRAHNYWVVTRRRDGRAYARPVWGVWLGGRFFFDSLSMNANLERDPRVEVHLESGDEVVVVEGTAARLNDESARKRFAAAYRRKYGEDPPEWSWTVTPRVAFGWTLARFGPSATRWRFPASAGISRSGGRARSKPSSPPRPAAPAGARRRRRSSGAS